MAFLTISGDPGCHVEEVARLASQRLRFALITETQIREMIAAEFGSEAAIPEKAWAAVATSLLAHLALEQPLVVCMPGAEHLLRDLSGVLRCRVVATENKRIGLLMLEHRLDRAGARQLLRQLERQARELRSSRFPRRSLPVQFDLTCNAQHLDSELIAGLIELAAQGRGLCGETRLSAAAEAQIQFQMRLQLAKFGIAPPGKVQLKRKAFANNSEEIFANLLDFYRIAWEYEPRSFPVQWDKDGRVIEAFTPDFYLPELDVYVELTTMKQAHVTKKNHKVKLLRSLYPHINIQVYYQKDFRNLIFKHGLAERSLQV